MAVKYVLCSLVLCLLCVNQIESKRSGGRGGGGGGGGGRRTGGGGYQTPKSNQPYPTQGYHYPANNNNGNQNSYQQSNSYQTGNQNPSAPNPPIGFGNHNPSAPNPPQSNNAPIGFENVHQRTGPQTSSQDVGFESVNNRVPLQNAPPPPGYQPPGGGRVPYQNGYNNQNPHYSQGGSYPNNYGNGQNGYQNNNYYHGGSQPGSYYNPQYNMHNGPPPQIYQPIQQSSGGSSFLGYGASFAGGYLIGKLTSGGGGGGGGGGDRSNPDDRQYTVHHYHNNRNDVPERLSVSDNNLVPCSQNETNSLCVPNTFPLCLGNGTIMCVTHLPYTTPCGANSTLACVVTVLPCSNDTACNISGNIPTTAVYIPCISNVTVNKRSGDTMVLPPSDFTNNQVKLCVTAIAEPKLTLSRVGSLGVLLGGILAWPLMMGINQTTSTQMTPSNLTTIRPDLYQTTIK